jgi:hypothetical protein
MPQQNKRKTFRRVLEAAVCLSDSCGIVIVAFCQTINTHFVNTWGSEGVVFGYCKGFFERVRSEEF